MAKYHLMNNTKNNKAISQRRLLSIKEVCEYLGIGETKARELVRGRNGFGLMIGNRWYADKIRLDEWITHCIDE